MSSGFFAGDPAAGSASCAKSGWIEGISWRRSNFAIQRHAGFQGHNRLTGEDKTSECFIDTAAFRFQQTRFNADSSCAQLFESLARHFWVWISNGRDHTLDAGCNQRIGTRRRASLMAMWFKIKIDSAAACARTGLLKSEGLSVLKAFKCVEAFAYGLSRAIHDHRTNAGAGRRKPTAAAGEIHCPAHEMLVLFR